MTIQDTINNLENIRDYCVDRINSIIKYEITKKETPDAKNI